MLLTIGMSAHEKMQFVIEGPEEMYNQIRVTNETSLSNFRCRIVILDEDNRITKDYGTYHLGGSKSTDTNTDRIQRGTRLGIQLQQDMDAELTFTVEYKDLPLFDAIIIHLYDKEKGFSNEF
jgi:hypothetical protein